MEGGLAPPGVTGARLDGYKFLRFALAGFL
jgi:hypothetical protein